jgi:curved DNA-binding protein CbpA
VSPTHYEVLGVPRDAGAPDVRRAYVALAQRHHPDRPGGDADRMREVNAAWATLGDPIARRRYDAELLGAASAEPRPASWAPTSASEEDDDRDGSFDDTVGLTIVLPRWMAMIPVGLFAASILLFSVGVLIGVPVLLGAAVMTFALSTLLFFAAPFAALYVSRRPNR